MTHVFHNLFDQKNSNSNNNNNGYISQPKRFHFRFVGINGMLINETLQK